MIDWVRWEKERGHVRCEILGNSWSIASTARLQQSWFIRPIGERVQPKDVALLERLDRTPKIVARTIAGTSIPKSSGPAMGRNNSQHRAFLSASFSYTIEGWPKGALMRALFHASKRETNVDERGVSWPSIGPSSSCCSQCYWVRCKFCTSGHVLVLWDSVLSGVLREGEEYIHAEWKRTAQRIGNESESSVSGPVTNLSSWIDSEIGVRTQHLSLSLSLKKNDYRYFQRSPIIKNSCHGSERPPSVYGYKNLFPGLLRPAADC
jgi:hypothetical protein